MYLLALCIFSTLFNKGFALCDDLTFNANWNDAQGKVLGSINCPGSSIISGDSMNRFAINNNNLVIAAPLYESEDYEYELTIDSASDRMYVIVTINPTNNHKPRFLNIPATIYIDENTAIGVNIFNFTTEDLDGATGGLAGITYVDYFKKFPVKPTKKWLIEGRKGYLFLNHVLDYVKQRTYNLGFNVFDSEFRNQKSSGKTILTIHVVDANDNFPKCSAYVKLANIQEDFTIGGEVARLNCSDEDSGLAGDLSYKLSSSNDQKIVDTFNMVGEVLKLKKQLDYDEGDRLYEIIADVFDKSAAPKSSTVKITVIVSDADDNVPIWPSATVATTVPETTAVGAIVLTVTATDKDKPGTAASTIQYGLATVNQDYFNVDSNTGDVILYKSISDVPGLSSVTFDVYAYSSDKINAKAIITVTINIEEKNNLAPRFEKNSYQDEISEDTETETSILTVKATDTESGVNGEVQYQLSSPYFKVDSNSGVVSLNQKVDFETKKVHSIVIEAVDKGTPRLTGSAYLLIRVRPVNEHDPVIVGPTEPIKVDEDKAPGTILFNFTATDSDDGADGEVTFAIQDTSQPFTIESKTGAFRVGSTLDMEQPPTSWDVVIIATDSSVSNVRSVSSTFNVQVQDVNDNAPKCDAMPDIIVTLPHQINMPLAKIQCTDADAGFNGAFTYTILSGNDDAVFSIDATGNVILDKNPTLENYQLVVVVSDTESSPLNVSLPVKILAETKFEFTNLPATINATENEAQAVELFDADACCVFGLTRYEVVSGNENNNIIADKVSGKIILTRPFDRESKSVNNFVIRAVSVDTNASIEADLTVRINDKNDNPPVFESSFYYKKVSENISISSTIFQLIATDRDSDINAEVAYSIVSGNSGTFDINPTDGNLILTDKIDSDVVPQYKLILKATDKGDPPKSGSTNVVIEVVKSEFKPQIVNLTDGVVKANISEDEALGALVIRFRAKDANNLTYSISGGNDGQHFAIDSSSGDIYLLKFLDRETSSQHNMTVDVASDTGKVSIAVTVDVVDINDNDPKFDQTIFQFQVTHEDPDDTLITTFTITDIDEGDNSAVDRIEIVDGNEQGRFKIENFDLKTNSIVDYSLGQSYPLRLKVTDKGNPARSSFASVLVRVQPKFKPPKFLLSEYNTTIAESVESDSTVFDVDATADGAEEGTNGNIRYEIRGGNTGNVFFISDTTGEVSTTTFLDFETTESYTLTIRAQSKEDPTLSSSTVLKIQITNVNDNTPTFSQASYVFNINEDDDVGDVVGSLTVVDNDKEPFGNFTFTFDSTDFAIDNNGQITVVAPLDFNRRNTYSIPVIASDGERQGSAAVVVVVKDVNNHQPKFTAENVAVEVSESIGIGEIFYTAKAEDLDSGSNGQISYTIQPPVAGFDITSAGSLSVNAALDRETTSSYELFIHAADQPTTGALTGTLTVSVTVLDDNDNSPVFSAVAQPINVPRSTSAGSAVSTISATDKDMGSNGAIDFEMSENPYFVIGSTTGEITTVSPLKQAANRYNLVVTATDRGLPSRSSTLDLTLEVTPFDFGVASLQEFTVSEGVSSNFEIGSVTLKPNHLTKTNTKFTIVEGNREDAFQIDNDGKLATAKALDREKYPQYILSIEIDDDVVQKYTKLVSVELLDVNDNMPGLSASENSFDIVENSPGGKVLTEFTVQDEDIGSAGMVDLTVTPGDKFEIVDKKLMLKVPLDYETETSINVVVTATDRGDPRLSVTLPITVNVIDVLDSETFVVGPKQKPSIYLTREASSNANKGEQIHSITLEEFGVDDSSGSTKMSYKSIASETTFQVQDTGSIAVATPDQLVAEKAYYKWVVGSATSPTASKDILGLIRIDTFDPNKHVVSLESPSDVETLETNRDAILASLRVFYPDDEPKIWKIKSFNSNSRRKLLSKVSEVLVYVINGKITNDVTDIGNPRTFKESSTLQNDLRERPGNDSPNPALTGNGQYVVDAVNGYSEPLRPPSVEPSSEDDGFFSSAEGYATLILILLFLVILVILLVFLYKKKKRDKNRKLDLEENSNRNDRTKGIIIPKGRGKELKSGKDKTPNPVPTVTEAPEPEKSEMAPVAALPVVTSTLKPPPSASTPRTHKRSTSVSPARLSPIQPMISQSKSAENIAMFTAKSQPEGELVSEEKTPSTIDDQSKNIPHRKNGPIVNRGKEYDGVAVNPDTQQRYAYNTRTGSTLYIEKDKGLGMAKAPVTKGAKNKPIQVLSAVSENAKADFTSNRSIGVLSQNK